MPPASWWGGGVDSSHEGTRAGADTLQVSSEDDIYRQVLRPHCICVERGLLSPGCRELFQRPLTADGYVSSTRPPVLLQCLIDPPPEHCTKPRKRCPGREGRRAHVVHPMRLADIFPEGWEAGLDFWMPDRVPDPSDYAEYLYRTLGLLGLRNLVRPDGPVNLEVFLEFR